MVILATTRFNKQTWRENIDWRDKHDFDGCIYNVPMLIKEEISNDVLVFVMEMNNDRNKVVGIGLIFNRIQTGRYKIYSDGNYNRYTYKSNYRISRNEFTEREEKFMKIMDQILFKGYRHLKRGQGITSVPKYLVKKEIIKFYKDMFTKRYS